MTFSKRHKSAQCRRSRPVCVSEISLAEACSGTGFGGLLLATLTHMLACKRLGLPAVARWADCSPYCGPRNGSNYWKTFFRTTEHEDYLLSSQYAEKYGAVCLYGQLPRQSLVDFAFEPSYAAQELIRPKITQEVRFLINRLLNRHARPSETIMGVVESFQAKHFSDERTKIGIHVRGTDRAPELKAKRVMELEEWIEELERLLTTLEVGEKDKPVTVFVASDSHESVRRIRRHFSRRQGSVEVVSTNAHRTEFHLDPDWESGLEPMHTAKSYVAGEEVMVDILLLSRCDYMIHGESNVAALATYFNPNLKLVYAKVEEKQHNQVHHKGEVLEGESEDEEMVEQDALDGLREANRCFRLNAASSSCSKSSVVLLRNLETEFDEEMFNTMMTELGPA